MERATRHGRVLWYDATLGYGFVLENQEMPAIFITQQAIEAFGLTGLRSGIEIAFEAVHGVASDRVDVILGVNDPRQLQ